jgi:hypothetical protein
MAAVAGADTVGSGVEAAITGLPGGHGRIDAARPG